MAEGAALPRRRGIGRAVARRLPLAGTLIGLGLAAWLIATHDVAAIGAAFGRIGAAGLVGVVVLRGGLLLLCGLAWARIVDGLTPAGTGACVVLRFVREGINVLLPVASIGGDVVGGRLLTFWGVTGAFAAASILADMLLQVGTQVAFTLVGASLLTQVEGAAAAALADWMLRVLGIAVAVLAAFFALQRTRAARVVEARLAGLGRRFVREAEPPPDRAATAAGGVGDALDAVWGRDRLPNLLQSAALHLAAWGFGVAEVAIVLACIGVEGVTLTEVVVIEALAQAIKAVAFPVPSGLGVQEGGFVVVGSLFGIDPDTAIALSLAKRVPDVVIGLPSLLVWQSLEARRGLAAARLRG